MPLIGFYKNELLNGSDAIFFGSGGFGPSKDGSGVLIWLKGKKLISRGGKPTWTFVRTEKQENTTLRILIVFEL